MEDIYLLHIHAEKLAIAYFPWWQWQHNFIADNNCLLTTADF